MNDTAIFRSLIALQLIDWLRTATFIAIIAALLYAVLHPLIKSLARRTPEQIVSEQTTHDGQDVLDADFRQWYDALCAQGDFSYAEAKAWYQLRDHEDVAIQVVTLNHDSDAVG